MNETKRITFVFDQVSLDNLETIQRGGGYTTLGDALSDALRITRSLQKQAAQGYSEVRVCNRVSGGERIAEIPDLLAGITQ